MIIGVPALSTVGLTHRHFSPSSDIVPFSPYSSHQEMSGLSSRARLDTESPAASSHQSLLDRLQLELGSASHKNRAGFAPSARYGSCAALQADRMLSRMCFSIRPFPSVSRLSDPSVGVSPLLHPRPSVQTSEACDPQRKLSAVKTNMLQLEQPLSLMFPPDQQHPARHALPLPADQTLSELGSTSLQSSDSGSSTNSSDVTVRNALARTCGSTDTSDRVI